VLTAPVLPGHRQQGILGSMLVALADLARAHACTHLATSPP
jgi:hypothetical protein